MFDNVVFGYSSAAGGLAVRNFSLTVPGGKTAALVGRSGAGKSTIINLVPRLFDVDSGRILIDGQDVRDVTLDTLRKSIAIVSQELTLFDDTIRNNIALGRLGASDAEIIAAAEAAAAHEFIIAQPQGYDTMVGDSGLRLSGGQRQRLALARAILKDAPILLLDEATSALDTESERLVQQALAQFTTQPHHARHRPPALHRAARRPHLRDGCRTPGRGGHPRRSDRGRRRLRAALPFPGSGRSRHRAEADGGTDRGPVGAGCSADRMTSSGAAIASRMAAWMAADRAAFSSSVALGARYAAITRS